MYLQLKDLTMKFGGLVAVNEVSLDVSEGSIHGLIGPNGSGKTTLFNMLSGYYTPTGGSIMFQGRPITGLKPHVITQMGFARTFQNLRLFRSMTVLGNVLVATNPRAKLHLWDLLLNPLAVSREEGLLRKKSFDALRALQIEGFADEIATSLPYGMQRRVEIARALATGPRVLLLDEPAAGLSADEADTLMEIVFELRSRGITVLLIEHHMKFVMKVCDTITVLDHGRKIAEGDPASISCNERVVEAYLGEEEAEAC